MLLGIAEHIEHHHAVRHRRENGAEAVLAVETLAYPRNCALDGALALLSREERLADPQHSVDSTEEPEPGRFLLRRLRRGPDRRGISQKELINAPALGIARLRL